MGKKHLDNIGHVRIRVAVFCSFWVLVNIVWLTFMQSGRHIEESSYINLGFLEFLLGEWTISLNILLFHNLLSENTVFLTENRSIDQILAR